jgi:protein-disulfide isomerase
MLLANADEPPKAIYSAPRTAAVVNKVTAPPVQTNFKEQGSPSAPVTIEIYVDFECMHCEDFVQDVVPRLAEQYVQTGKAKLLYRDYPLPSHPHARLAARYADAAGELGLYREAMTQLFATRKDWSESGDIDSAIAEVLPAEVMEKVRERVKIDARIDDGLAADLAAGVADHLKFTPFVVVVSGGERHAMIQAPVTFEVLSRYLDGPR